MRAGRTWVDGGAVPGACEPVPDDEDDGVDDGDLGRGRTSLGSRRAACLGSCLDWRCAIV